MLEAAEITKDDIVLEIGPGPGALTQKLVRHAKHVIAVEFDEALARDLLKRVTASNLQVTHEDILRFDLTTLPPGYKVVANIPYYLTSNLLRTLCESSNPFSQAAILIQKEVTERICAQAGAMSLLSISVQFYCEASLGERVPAKLFVPPPKVDSQILKLVYRPTPLFPGIDRKAFFRLVKAGFSQRRKTLLNALSAGLQQSRGEVEALLVQADIAPQARAQTLSLEDWYRLYKAHQANNT